MLGKAVALLCGEDDGFSPFPAAALASGTPLLTTIDSAAADLVVDGETGWIVRSIDDAVAKVAELGVVSRRVCRREAELNFSPAAVVNSYEMLYRTLLPMHQAMPGSSVLLGARSEVRSPESIVQSA